MQAELLDDADTPERDANASAAMQPGGESPDAEIKRKAKVLQGAPVAVLTGDEAPRKGFAALRQWATDLFRQQGGKARHPQIGEVLLDARAVRDSSGHGMSPYKAAAFAAVKDVIEQGVLVTAGIVAGQS